MGGLTKEQKLKNLAAYANNQHAMLDTREENAKAEVQEDLAEEIDTIQENRNASVESRVEAENEKIGYTRSQRRHRIAEIIGGILMGIALAGFIVAHGRTVANPSDLTNFTLAKHIEVARDWLRNYFIPNLNNLPALFRNILPQNFEEIATALLAGGGFWMMIRNRFRIWRDRRAANRRRRDIMADEDDKATSMEAEARKNAFDRNRGITERFADDRERLDRYVDNERRKILGGI